MNAKNIIFSTVFAISAFTGFAGCQSSSTDSDSDEVAVDDDGHLICDAPKVLICHVPPGNDENPHEICIAQSALNAHLNTHGEGDPEDYYGECQDIVEPTCEEKGDCPEPTCEELGNCEEPTCEELGNCEEPTCEELGNCEEPSCEELGNCPEPTCEELGNCPPVCEGTDPNCQQQEEVPQIIDRDPGCTDPNGCYAS